MIVISSDKTVSPTSSYSEYIKNNIKTNIKSYNTGTEEAPNYITWIQPFIEFELISKEKNEIGIDKKEDLINFAEVVGLFQTN